MSFSGNSHPSGVLVLIVDDCKDTAESMGMLLSLHGYAYITAYSGEEAVGIIKNITPDVIICDIKMPKEDGWHLARRLRRRISPKPLMIAHSGLGTPADRQRSEEAGFDFHFTKPADPALLARLLSVYVAKGKDPHKDHPPHIYPEGGKCRHSAHKGRG